VLELRKEIAEFLFIRFHIEGSYVHPTQFQFFLRTTTVLPTALVGTEE
jgi:hypothetical protein